MKNISGLNYQIINVWERNFELSNKGCIEAHMKGNFAYPWKRPVKEYHISVIREDEDFVRTLVMDENEYKINFSQH